MGNETGGTLSGIETMADGHGHGSGHGAAPDSNLSAPDSDLGVPDSNLSAPDSDLSAPDSDLGAPDSDLSAPDSDLAARDGFRLAGTSEVPVEEPHVVVGQSLIEEPQEDDKLAVELPVEEPQVLDGEALIQEPQEVDKLDAEVRVEESQVVVGEAPIEEPQEDGELDEYLVSQLEKLSDTQKLHFKGIIISGNFDSEVVDYLADKRMWTPLVKYLKKCVVRHAANSILPTPAGASPEDICTIHAEVFLSAHKPQILDLIAYHVPARDSGLPRRYFDEHVLPLWQSVPHRQWLHTHFNLVNQIVAGTVPLPSLSDTPKEASRDIKDYMFIYFPQLRPPLDVIRGQQQSLVWLFGEKVWLDGTRGFRCYSCHKLFRASGANRLREHLEGGSSHQGRCPAVLPCVLESLALI